MQSSRASESYCTVTTPYSGASSCSIAWAASLGLRSHPGGGRSTLARRGEKATSTSSPIKDEASSGLSNAYGTIAMARTSQADSATNPSSLSVCRAIALL